MCSEGSGCRGQRKAQRREAEQQYRISKMDASTSHLTDAEIGPQKCTDLPEATNPKSAFKRRTV